MKDLVIFLTHDFKPVFLKTLLKMNEDFTDLEVIVLFDGGKTYDTKINDILNHIKIIKMTKVQTSYDWLGHSMYINYFKQSPEKISEYKYIWTIENDVYFPQSMKVFIDKHASQTHDLLTGEYGSRCDKWFFNKNNSLRGLENKKIGVFAAIIRFSSQMMKMLIENIDKNYYGFLEILLPHACLHHGLTISIFNPELVGILTTVNGIAEMIPILDDIRNCTKNHIKDKIYHPVKL